MSVAYVGRRRAVSDRSENRHKVIASNIRLTITAEQRLLQKSKIEQP
jgi:hypothetical protein